MKRALQVAILAIAILLSIGWVPAANAQGLGVQLGESVRISGYTRAYFETSNQQRFGQLVPNNRFRWEFAPTFFVKGVPLSTNIMYTTDDNVLGRQIGGFSFSLNLGTNELEQIIRDRIDRQVEALGDRAAGATGADELIGNAQDLAAGATDAKENAEARITQLLDLRDEIGNARPSFDQLQNLGLMTAQERLAMRFPALGIGTTYPVHSPYSLNGIAISGLNIEFQPGPILLGVTGGKVRDPLPFTNRFLVGIDSLSYKRSIYAARVGVGRTDGKHFLISATYFADEKTDSTLFFAPRRPEENLIALASTRWSDPQRTVTLFGEAAASVYTGDRQGATLADDLPIPGFLENRVTINSTSSGNWAARGGIDVRLRAQAMKIGGDFDQVGPGYVTLGNPLLRNDFRRINGRFEKQFARRQVAFSAQVRTERNNLSGFQLYTTTSTSISTRLSVRFRGKPWFMVQFMPTRQNTDTGADNPATFVSEFNSTNLSLAAGHRYQLAESVSGTTNINVLNQRTTTNLGDFDLSTTVMSLTQAVTVSRLTFAGTASLFRQGKTSLPMNSNVFDVSVSVQPMRDVQTTVGVNLFDDVDRSNEKGVYASVSANAGPVGTLYARVETSRFTDEVFDSGSFNQTQFVASVLKRW